MINLDMLAAQKAQAIIANTVDKEKLDKSDVENLVTKALGVVQEQGVYAGMLFILSRGSVKEENGKKNDERMIAEAVRDQLVSLLSHPGLVQFQLTYSGNNDDPQQLLKHFAECVCAKPVQTLLLVKNLFEQTLMYARFSAKACSEPNKQSGNQPEKQG